MAIKRRASGAWVDPAAIKRRSGGAWVAVTSVKRRVGGAWVETLITFTLTSSTDSGYESGIANSGPVTSNGVGVNGATNVTWSYVSGDSGTSVSNANGTFVTFSAAIVYSAMPKTVVWRCTNNATGATADVTVTLTYERM